MPRFFMFLCDAGQATEQLQGKIQPHLLPQFIQADLFGFDVGAIEKLGAGSTRLYCTAPVNAAFNAVLVLLLRVLGTVTVVTAKRQVLIDDDREGKDFNLLKQTPLSFVEHRPLTNMHADETHKVSHGDTHEQGYTSRGRDG